MMTHTIFLTYVQPQHKNRTREKDTQQEYGFEQRLVALLVTLVLCLVLFLHYLASWAAWVAWAFCSAVTRDALTANRHGP
jgi:hypothetical protein